MTMPDTQFDSSIQVHAGDLPASCLERALDHSTVAWDIETSGLDWSADRIAVCQVHLPREGTHVVQVDASPHPHLVSLLQAPHVQKVFHHALFDLRFLRYHWKVRTQNVACTKVAAKILNPGWERHSLKGLLRHHLGLSIEKEQQTSDWFRDELTAEQIRYAAGDVIHLIDLLTTLRDRLASDDLLDVTEASFDFIPHRVDLDVRGSGDVFTY